MDKQERYYNIFNLNRLFAISSIFFFVLIVWTFIDDYDRNWKYYQREFRTLESDQTRNLLLKERERIQELEEYQNAVSELELAQRNLDSRQDDMSVLEKQERKLQAVNYKAQQELSFIKSDYDATRFRYEDAVTRGNEKAQDIKIELDELEADVSQKNLIVQEAEASLATKSAEIDELKKQTDDAMDKVGKFSKEADLIERKLRSVDPTAMTVSNRIASAVRDLPVVDFLNPYIKINQIILPEIRDELNFMRMPKVCLLYTSDAADE